MDGKAAYTWNGPGFDGEVTCTTQRDRDKVASVIDLLMAMETLVDRDITYQGNVVQIPFDDHIDGIKAVLFARAAIARSKGDA